MDILKLLLPHLSSHTPVQISIHQLDPHPICSTRPQSALLHLARVCVPARMSAVIPDQINRSATALQHSLVLPVSSPRLAAASVFLEPSNPLVIPIIPLSKPVVHPHSDLSSSGIALSTPSACAGGNRYRHPAHPSFPESLPPPTSTTALCTAR